ncbi:hypothetical protein OIY81_2487 [Cryptosporidium canis]|nr:hypothetical protein OIY81_2487 [Cryptosporidium canis]
MWGLTDLLAEEDDGPPIWGCEARQTSQLSLMMGSAERSHRAWSLAARSESWCRDGQAEMASTAGACFRLRPPPPGRGGWCGGTGHRPRGLPAPRDWDPGCPTRSRCRCSPRCRRSPGRAWEDEEWGGVVRRTPHLRGVRDVNVPAVVAEDGEKKAQVLVLDVAGDNGNFRAEAGGPDPAPPGELGGVWTLKEKPGLREVAQLVPSLELPEDQVAPLAGQYQDGGQGTQHGWQKKPRPQSQGLDEVSVSLDNLLKVPLLLYPVQELIQTLVNSKVLEKGVVLADGYLQNPSAVEDVVPKVVDWMLQGKRGEESSPAAVSEVESLPPQPLQPIIGSEEEPVKVKQIVVVLHVPLGEEQRQRPAEPLDYPQSEDVVVEAHSTQVGVQSHPAQQVVVVACTRGGASSCRACQLGNHVRAA